MYKNFRILGAVDPMLPNCKYILDNEGNHHSHTNCCILNKTHILIAMQQDIDRNGSRSRKLVICRNKE